MAEIESTETVQKRSLKDFAIAKRDYLIFFVLNLALVIPFIVENYTHWGLGAAFLIMLWAFFRCVVKSVDLAPAAVNIPRLLFFDLLVYLAVSYEKLAAHFFGQNFLDLLDNMSGNGIYLLLVGIVINIVISKKKVKHQWLRNLIKVIIGAAFVLMIWSEGNLLHPVFHEGGEIIFIFYLMFSVMWFTFCSISYHLNIDAVKRNGRLSNLLLILLVLFCSTEFELAMEFAMDFRSFLLDMPYDGLAWWKVLLGAVILVGCAVVTYDRENGTMGADSLVLCFIASAMLLLRVLMDNYFLHSWIIFIVFLFSCLRCLKNERNGKKTLRLNSLAYTAVQIAVLIGAVLLLKASLWIDLVIIALYTLIFYNFAAKGTAAKQPRCFWLVLLSAPAVYAIAHIWQTRFHTETLVLILMAYAVFAGAMLLLHASHPEDLKVPKAYKAILCAFLALLCWFAMSSHGVRVDIQPDLLWEEAYVEITPNGKDNAVTGAQYQWKTRTGETLSMGELPEAGTPIPIEGEVLTVTVTDAYGARTTKTQWYPDWLIAVDTEESK